MSAPVLLLDNVTKRFGDFTAVDALSFMVPEGGVFGFLGGNGAGKTTSLRMTLDILRPTSGRIEVFGPAPSRDHAAQIGFLPEERGLYRGMTVLETVIYFARLKGMGAASARKAALGLFERLDLTDRAASQVGKLSKGLAQKVQLATALVNAPRLVFLDEPFSGLDPVSQGMLEEVIRDLAQGGATVIFSTHIMQHAERLCGRLVLLARGRKVFEGTQEEARGVLPGRLTLRSRGDPTVLPGVVSATPSGTAVDGWTGYQVALAAGVAPADLLEICTAQAFALRDFDIHQPTLHEAFIHLVAANREIMP